MMRQAAPMKPGDCIQFNQVFGQDLPNADDRSTLLAEFASTPGTLTNAWIDVDQGLIYLYSPGVGTKAVSIAVASFALVLVGGATVGTCYLGALPAIGDHWPLKPADSGPVLIAWLAVLVGVVLHMIVDTVKVTQAQGAQLPNISLNQVPVWIETHLGTVVLKLVLTLVGLFTVVFTIGVQSLTPFYGLLVGYSLDSIIGLANNTLGQQSSAFVAMLKQKMGGSSGSSGSGS